MTRAFDLASNPEEIVEMKKKNDGRFTKGDPRTREAGRKGGSTPHATGSKTGMTYKYRGFEIAWDKRRNLWRAKSGAQTLYARSHHEMTAEVRKYLSERPEFIETPEVVA